MLRVFHSNRYELLVDELGRLLRQHSNSPLQRQTIVIPETGIARWTWMSLANNHGISANLEFVLPGSFVWRLFHLLLPDVNDTSPYDIRIMTLRLFELLEEVLQEPGNDALGPWRDSDELRRFQLAQKLAIQFDQYIVYRPRWIARASAGKETDWQARLWQRLAQHTGEPDWMALRARLETLSSESVQAVLTRPVYLLGIPLLSPGYFEVLEWLAQHVDVHLLIPNPSRAYWGDIVAPQDAPRIAGVGDQQALYLEHGNRLLASWGRQARDLIDMVDASAAVNDDNFVDPADDSLLHHLHGQILDLEEPATPIGLHAGDRSLQVHACHTPMREVEVLYDQLLALIDADATLEPSAVMVMTPDIQTYAPCIDAVFGSRERIAYRICGSDDVQGQPLVASFLAIARLQQSRFDANEVLALLDNPAVRRRFGLQPDDIASLRSWIHKTGIRWGLDENNRPGLEGDAARLHTWEYGLSSMLLGWMLPDDKQGIHKSTLLFSEIEGSDALVAAALAEFVERLAVFHRDSQRPRTIQQWAGWLQRQLDLFFQPDQAEEVQAQLLRDALAKLHEYATAANNESTFNLATVLHWMTDWLGSQQRQTGFLGAGVTFCGITPMRTVPMRVIALLGMDYQAFPRRDSPPGFDLIARSPQRGDRSRRGDDRFAFLDCLLNAREVFYLSHCGRGVRDNESRPPSVLVTELIEYCNEHFSAANGATAVVVTEHPLHGASRRYFDGRDDRLFSYSATRASAAAMADGDIQPEFVPDSMPALAEQTRSVELDELIRFYKDPSKYWLRQRLGIDYNNYETVIDTTLPVTVRGLEGWQARERALEMRLAGRSRTEILEHLRFASFAPPGPFAEHRLGELVDEVAQLAQQIPQRDLFTEAVEGTIDIADTELHCRLVGTRDGYVDFRAGKTRAADRIALWLRHLAWQLLAPDGVAKSSNWYSLDTNLAVAPVDEPEKYLAELVRHFHEGQSVPLPFFPATALAYSTTLAKKGDTPKSRAAASKAALSVFNGTDFGPKGEGEDPHIRRLYGAHPPITHCFDLADQILLPLNVAMDES